MPAPGPNLTHIVHSFFISSTRTVDFISAPVSNMWIGYKVPGNVFNISTFTNSDFLTNVTGHDGGGACARIIGANDSDANLDYTTVLNKALYLTSGGVISSGNGTCRYYLWYSIVSVA